MENKQLREFIQYVLKGMMNDDSTLDDEAFKNVGTHLKNDEQNEEDPFGPVPPRWEQPSVSLDPYVGGDVTRQSPQYVNLFQR